LRLAGGGDGEIRTLQSLQSWSPKKSKIFWVCQNICFAGWESGDEGGRIRTPV